MTTYIHFEVPRACVSERLEGTRKGRKMLSFFVDEPLFEEHDEGCGIAKDDQDAQYQEAYRVHHCRIHHRYDVTRAVEGLKGAKYLQYITQAHIMCVR